MTERGNESILRIASILSDKEGRLLLVYDTSKVQLQIINSSVNRVHKPLAVLSESTLLVLLLLLPNFVFELPLNENIS